MAAARAVVAGNYISAFVDQPALIEYAILIIRYELEVEARDNGVPRRIGTTTLRISVTDVDDISPRFERSFYQEQVAEGNQRIQV